MAEAYTHIKAARKAQEIAKINIPFQNAYEMGAQGPDPFFCGDFIPKVKEQKLSEIGHLIHNEQCGTFLLALITKAKTPVQRSYALGFLQHYATDIEVHPYVASQMLPGEKFAITGGHGFCEMALESYLCEQDTGSVLTTADITAPVLKVQELAQIGVILSECIKEVFEKNACVADIINAFHCFRIVHSVNRSKHGVKKMFARCIDSTFKTNAYLESHVTPGKIPEGGLANSWLNPYTKKQQNCGANELVEQSAKRGAFYSAQAVKYYRKQITEKELFNAIGSNSYLTGLNWNIKFDDNFERVCK